MIAFAFGLIGSSGDSQGERASEEGGAEGGGEEGGRRCVQVDGGAESQVRLADFRLPLDSRRGGSCVRVFVDASGAVLARFGCAPFDGSVHGRERKQGRVEGRVRGSS